MPEQTQRHAASSPKRLFLFSVMVAALAFVITLSFGYADHAPRPHDVRIAVAAPVAVSASLTREFARHDPGAFDLVSVPNAHAATRSVRSQVNQGAFIVPAGGANTIVTAGAEGTVMQQAITQVLTAASAAMQRPVKALDVAHLTAGDQSGFSTFVFGFGLLVPSVIGSVGLFLLGARFRLWWRVAAAALFALLAACGGVLAMDTIFGALTGAWAELIAIGFVGALSFVLTVAALQAVVGLSGTGVAALGFIFVGNAISGGTVPVLFLPQGFRQIAPWLPNNAIIRGARDVIYFGGHDLGHPLLVFAIWPAAALLVLTAVDVLHGMERRAAPHLAAEIHQTSAIAHLKGRRARARAQDLARETGGHRLGAAPRQAQAAGSSDA